jgi:hypothetical protein
LCFSRLALFSDLNERGCIISEEILQLNWKLQSGLWHLKVRDIVIIYPLVYTGFPPNGLQPHCNLQATRQQRDSNIALQPSRIKGSHARNLNSMKTRTPLFFSVYSGRLYRHVRLQPIWHLRLSRVYQLTLNEWWQTWPGGRSLQRSFDGIQIRTIERQNEIEMDNRPQAW